MIFIDYDRKKNRLVAECSFNENGLIKAMPSRKFDVKTKKWNIPICRKNIEYIRALGNKVTLDAGAKGRIERHMSKVSLPAPTPFPHSYVFKTKPYSQQITALNESHDRDLFGLFMEMGTGKSKVAVDKATNHFLNGQINGLLIFCPVSIKTNWVEQLHEHCPLNLDWKQSKSTGAWESPCVRVCDLSTKAAERATEEFIGLRAPFKVFIVGMESLSVGCAEDGKGGRAYAMAERFALAHQHMQCVDEAHGIRGHDSNRTTNIIKLGHYCKIKMLMTGTPVLQSLLDLYSYFQYLDPDIIGLDDWYSFRARYAILSEDGFNRVVAYDNVDELLSAVKPYIYQVTKAECLDLPAKVYQTRYVELSKEQRKVYNDIKNSNEWKQDEKHVEIENALQKYSALQTIIGGFINYDDPNAPADFDIAKDKKKVKRLTSAIVEWKRNPIITELLNVVEESGEQSTIVWAVHRFEIQEIAKALRAKYGHDSVVEYHGGVSIAERDANKKRFLEKRARFFVGNQTSGGVGLTLNVATLVVYCSNSFKLIDRLQSEDRNHRIGQHHSVTYVDLVAVNTVDQNIIDALRSKKDLADWVKERLGDGRRDELAIF